ncbi:MAG: rRNA maturation RNAse YbeY [Pseudomonadota bacterium]
MLHLIGYDHEKVPPAKAQRMRRRERQIRAAL